MFIENETRSHDDCGKRNIHDRHMMGGTYGLAFIGAAIYFIQHAMSFWDGVFGIVKAIVWPAVLVYKLLEFLHL